MISLDEAIKQVQEKYRSPLEQSRGISFDEALAAVQGVGQSQSSAWINDPLADTAGAFTLGAANMLNDTVVGGTGYLLGNLGRGVEYISPFSGRSNSTVNALLDAGYTLNQIESIAPYEDNWLTSAAKGTLYAHNTFQDAIDDTRTRWLGEDPSKLARISEGSGSSIGFMLAGLLMGSNLLTSAIMAGSSEALSEAGGFMGDAYRNGQYDNGALGAANKSFLANAVLNTGLDYHLAPYGKLTENIANPFKRYAYGTIGEVLNEILQEPSQHVIEEAAKNSLNNGTGFMPELGQSIQQWPELFAQLAPEVAVSTLLTQGLLGVAGLSTRCGRRSLATESLLSRNGTLYTDKDTGITYGSLNTHNVDSANPLFDLLNPTQEERQQKYDNLVRERDNLNEQANDIYLGYGNDTEPNGEASDTLHGILSRITGLNEQINSFWGNDMKAEEDINLFPEEAEPALVPDEQSSSAEPTAPAPERPASRLLRDLLPDEQQMTIPDNQPLSPNFDTEGSSEARTERIRQELKETQHGVEGTRRDTRHDTTVDLGEGIFGSQQDAQQLSIPNMDSTLPSLTSLGKPDYTGDIITTVMGNLSATPSRAEPSGNIARVRTMRGTEADIRYRVVDAQDLIVSTKETGAPNPDYPQELQPRQRNREASFQQINRMAHNLDPELLGENRLASDGAPVIGTDNVVESGNGRVMAIRQAYKIGKAENYRAWLKENASRFGLDAGEIDSMNAPVLVRERISDVDRVKFTSEANESSTAQMSATEHAFDDAKKITSEMLTYYDPEKLLSSNHTFINAFMGLVSQNERGDLIQANGRVSKAGLDRVQNALLAKAYGNTDILNRLNELYDDDIKNVSNALIASAPKLAVFENGGYSSEISIKDDIVKAVHTLAHLKQEGRKVLEYLAQMSLFDDVSDETKKLLEFFDRNKRSAKRISNGLIHYADSAMTEARQGQSLLFVDSARTKGQILDEAIRYAENDGGENYGQAVDSRGSDKFSFEHNGKKQTISINSGEFSDKYPVHKKLFGRYLEIRDSIGKVIARYSPYADRLEFSKNVPDDSSFRQKVYDTLGRNLDPLMSKHGFIDESGNMVQDGNEGYRRQELSRMDKAVRRKAGQSVQSEAKPKKGILSSLKDAVKNSIKGKANEVRSRYARFKSSVNQIAETAYDSFASEAEKSLRADIKEKIDGLNVFPEVVNEKVARIMASAATHFASYAGLTPEEYLRARGFDIKADLNPMAGFTRDKNTEELQRDKNGNYIERRGDYSYLPPNHTDKDGNIIEEAENIITLFQKADPSTIIHEMGHFFLNDFRDLMQEGKLRGMAKQDWTTLTKWLEVEDIDLTKSTDEMTDEERARWTDAHEKFAVGFEKYLMTGKAPTMKLARVFEVLKRIMGYIYKSIENVKYQGTDGELHEVRLSPEIKKVMGNMFTDIDRKMLKKAEARSRADTYGGQESYSQSVRQDNEKTNSEVRSWQEAVDKVLSGETGKREHIKVMNTPHVFNLIGAKPLPVYMDASKIRSVLDKHPAITSEIIKQIPSAITDPIAIFRSATHPNDSIVVMTEITDKDGGTVIVPVQMDVEQDSYRINRIASVFAKKNDKTGQVHNEWFTEQVNSGRLLYLNKKKGSHWSDQTGLQLSVGSFIENLMRSIPDETDLAKLIEKNQKDIDRDMTHFFGNTKTFITPEDIERYSQPNRFHGSGYTLEGGRFMLSKVGSGEGGQAFGYGIYVAENRDVAEAYRRSGLPNHGLAPITITTNDGITYTAGDDRKGRALHWNNNPNSSIKHVLDDIHSYVRYSDSADMDSVKQSLLRKYQNEFEEAKRYNSKYEQKLQQAASNFDRSTFGQIVTDTRDAMREIQNMIDVLNNVIGINISQSRKGNIYNVDIDADEDTELLNWDKPLSEQPEKVQKAIRKIKNKLKSWGMDYDIIASNKHIDEEAFFGEAGDEYGEDFYRNLTAVFDELLEKHKLRSKKFGMITRPDMGASFLLNQYGIPGLRYFDRQNRAEQNGTHNFVIWDTDKLKVMGLTEDSDKNAIEAFNREYEELNTPQKQMDKVRSQYKGTELWLKAPNGNDTNLTEQQWIQVRTPAFKQWFGDWEHDPDNSSKILDANGEPLVVYHGTSVPVDQIRTFERGKVGWLGPGIYLTPYKEYANQFSDKGEQGIMPLFLNLRKPLTLTSTWRIGRPYLELLQKLYGEQADDIYQERYDAVTERDKNILADMPNDAKRRQYIHRRIVTGDEVNQLLAQGYDGINWDDGEYSVLEPIQVKSAAKNNGNFSSSNPEIYHQSANDNKTDTASLLDKYSGILDRVNQRDINPDNLSSNNDGFISDKTFEHYNQDSLQGTGHTLLGNRMKLNKVGTGEGGSAFGYGIYSAQSRGVAESYRLMGIPNKGRGTIHIKTSDGHIYSAPDKNNWNNLPRVTREVLDDFLAWAVDYPDLTVDEIKDYVRSKLQMNLLLINRNSGNTSSQTEKVIEQQLHVLDSIKSFNFTPDENSGRKGNLYKLDVPENDVLLNWDATLDEQPEHVEKAISKMKQFLRRMANEYELDFDDINSAETGEDLYWAVTSLMEQYLDDNNPDDGITRPDARASMLFNRFAIPGHRYWDGDSRAEIDKKFEDYRTQNPMFNGRKAYSVAKTNDGKTYTSDSTDWVALWDNNPEPIMCNVLNELQRKILHGVSLEEAKDNLLRYPGLLDDDEKKAFFDALDSITEFDFIPEIKPDKSTPFSLFGNEGTRNFVVWNEDMIKILGIDPSSDQNAIDYFYQYKAEHPDSFINSDAAEHYEQLKLHATGHIIYNNRFDISFKGTGEGGAAFGHGIYFAENPDVANTYRRKGLKNGGKGNIHISTSDGITFSTNGYHSWSNNPNNDILSVLLSIEDDVNDARTWGKTPNKERIIRNLSKGLRQDLRLMQDNLTKGLDSLKALNEGSEEYNSLNDDISAVREIVQSLKDKLAFLKSINSFSVETDKNGNIYTADIPEDNELLDWDATLDRQSSNITPLVQKAIDAINNNPAELLAFSFSRQTNNPINSQAKLQAIISSVLRKYNHHYLDTYEFRKLQEYSKIRELLLDEDIIDDFRLALNNLLMYQPILPEHSSTGENLYRTLAGLLGSDEYASNYLNSLDIPGHRYWDRFSRDKQQGTHNYVIWNTDKITITDISDDSDNEAKQYFTEHKNSFVSDELIEHYDQLALHGTRHIINGNRFNLEYIGSGEGTQAFGYGIYLAQNKDVAQTYRTAGIPDIEMAKALITADNGNTYSELDFFNYIRNKLRDLGLDNQGDINLIASSFSNHIVDFVDGKYKSINDAVRAYIKDTISMTTLDHKLYSDIIKQAAELFSPKDAVKGSDRKGNLYSVDIPEDFDLLDWDAPISEQPQNVLDRLKRAGLYFNDSETGEELYRRIAGELGENKLASMKLNDAGIPGHRFFDNLSRKKEKGTHNFVIWNTDTLHLLGISDDSDEDAQDYFRTQKYYDEYLDSLDNDSYVTEYSRDDENYLIDRQVREMLDALDNNSENYDQLMLRGTRFNMQDDATVHRGKGDGRSLYGSGLYLSESRATAEHFRLAGYNELERAIFSDNNGNTFTYNQATSSFVQDFLQFLAENEIKRSKGDKLPTLLQAADIYIQKERDTLNKYKKLLDEAKLRAKVNPENASDVKFRRKLFNLQKKKFADIEANIPASASLAPEPNGNIYSFDGPENFELLDWDTPVAQQSDKIIKALKQSRLNLPDNITGGEFHEALSNKFGGDKNGDDKASAWLNKKGIPGLRYLNDYIPEAKGTHDFTIWNTRLLRFLDVEGDAEASESYSQSNTPYSFHSFVSPQDLEHYEQLAYHGTDNTIYANSFNLKYQGSSEGSSAYGYGAYFAENISTAEAYRHFGDPHLGDWGVAISTNDGNTYLSQGNGAWSRNTNAYMHSVLDDLYSLAIRQEKPDLITLKKEILKSYRLELHEHKKALSRLKHDDSSTAHGSIQEHRKHIDTIQKKIDALKSVHDLSVRPKRKGNIYSFNIPENDELLDWNKSIPKQPDAVRQARKEILQELKYWGLDISNVKKAKTGEDFYRSIQALMTRAGDAFAYPEKGISDPQQRTSLILNMHGIPGLRYIDEQSRGENLGNMHNFVIWNTDTLTMLGVQGNHEAEQYFRQTQQNSKEQYSQILGEHGTRRLDEQDGNTNRLDNLDLAKNMLNAGKDAKTIKLATGWELGHDSKWRYEIPDGKINSSLLDNHGFLLPNSYSLKDLYINDELYRAYPDIADIKVSTSTLSPYTSASYSPLDDSITISDNIPLSLSHLVHEIQHAIQRREGFPTGANYISVWANPLRKYTNARYKEILDEINTPLSIEDYARGGWGSDEITDEIKKAYKNYLKSFKEDSQSIELRNEAQSRAGRDIYKRVAGEVEARNVQRRINLSQQERSNTTLTDTEDVEPEHQIIVNQENFSQNMENVTPQQQLEQVRKLYKGTEQWMKAPNGRKSNLSELQWLTVRTTNFKAWFGDWQNNPENASRVVDENGEPLVLFRGTPAKLGAIFVHGKNFYGGNKGFWFTTAQSAAKDYSFDAINGGYGEVKAVFLNAHNILDLTPLKLQCSSKAFLAYIRDNFGLDLGRGSSKIFRTNELYEKYQNDLYNTTEFDGIKLCDVGITYIVKNPTQIKSAIDNNGDFDTRNQDIYYQSANDDRRYFDALNSGNTDIARAIIDTQAQLKGYSTDSIHRTSHRPADSHDGDNPNMAEVMNSDFVPKDFWTHPEHYLHSQEDYEAFNAVTNAINNHKHNITVYRAVPRDVKEKTFRNGDWVTPSLSYAKLHAKSNMNVPSRIISQSVPLNHLWWDGNAITEWGYDDGQNYAYRNTKNGRKLNDTVAYDANGEIVPPSKRFDYRRSETYYQRNPHVQRYDTFNNPDTEAEYSERSKPESSGTLERITQAANDFFHGLKGDFPELAGNDNFTFSREILRRMNRQTEAMALQAIQTLDNSLKGLSKRQFNIFSRLMLINVLYSFKRHNPDAALPLGFTPDTLKSERIRFYAMAQKDNSILDALRAEHETHIAIQKQLADKAQKLGLAKFAEKVKRYDFYFLDYARLLGGDDFYANYVEAVAETRNEYLQDIERLNALLEIRDKHDIKQELITKFGKDWQRHIPKGYKIFNPLAGRFLHSAHTLTENILDMALEQAGKNSGISNEAIQDFRQKLSDNSDSHLLVLPSELSDTLTNMTKGKQRGPLGKIAKAITTGWKKYVLYFPTRAFKYNIRNMTGDLDAAIAGNPQSLSYLRQAMSELWELYYGNRDNITSELKEFQKRGGTITIQTTQELGDYKQLKEFQNLINDMQDKDLSAWRKLPRKAWELIDKFAWSGIQNFSDFREQWLRYANYLSYLHQMQDNNGSPNNWGASVKQEVLALQDIRDRAFKMSNELLGAYDQVSQTGRYLRDIAVPFYSWLEVNAKRYYQLIKNGINEDNSGDFASRFLKGQLANAPYYAFKLGKTYLMVNLLSMLIAAFNHIVWPDDEDKLPPDIQNRPHITLGHDTNGNVLYFDRVGAMLDNLEWFGQDDSPFAPFAGDIKDIFDGKQTFSGFLGKIASAPVNKAVNALNPFFKLPAELLSGKSFYPNAVSPRNIRDKIQYIAQSLGLNWPYKAITGQPRNDWHEFMNIFLYSANADEAAYFYSLSKVHEFHEKVLHRRFDGFASTQRSDTLHKLKTALRLDDKQATQRLLREYYGLGGSRQGLKTSMRAMNPLSSLSKNEQKLFLRWLSPEDRKYLERANRYFHKIADKFLR